MIAGDIALVLLTGPLLMLGGWLGVRLGEWLTGPL